MTGVETLVARAALGILAAAVSLIAVSVKKVRETSNATFDRLTFWAYLISRLGLYGLVFLVLKILPRGDIPSYYVPEARSILEGSLPYRGLSSSYAPLHPYLDGAVLLIWNSPLALILLSIVVESFLLPVWIRLSRPLFSERHLRTAIILYLTSAVSLQFVAIDGQDNAIIAVMLALATLCLCKRRPLLSGALVGLATALIKILPLLYVPAFLFGTRQWRRWSVGFAGAILFGYGYFAYLRLPLLSPLQSESAQKGAGSLPYLIESVLGVNFPDKVLNGLTLFVLVIVFGIIVVALRRASVEVRLRVLVVGMAALTLTLLLVSKKSWPPYLMLSLFPICLLITSERIWRIVVFGLFEAVAITEHSYWSSIYRQASTSKLHSGLRAHDPFALIMLAFEIVLLAGYGWLLYESVLQVVETGHLTSGPMLNGPEKKLC